MRRLSRLILAILILLAFSATAGAQAAPEAPSIRAGTIAGVIAIDGVLDEAAWSAADAIPSLTMIEPSEGATPEGRTSVRILVRATEILFGVVCDDAAPDGIVSFTKQRDGSLRNEDNIKIVLDTFLDGRSGYVFQVNPGGARYDALINPGGDSENSNWDAIWTAATRRSPSGWTAEIRIPTQTLDFNPDLHEWHFNVERRIQRLQETDRWASPRRDWKLTQTSRAGLLTGLPALTQGRGLAIRPSMTSGGGIDAPGAPVGGVADASLDVTQRLGPNLMSSLSATTSFRSSAAASDWCLAARFLWRQAARSTGGSAEPVLAG